VRYPISDLFALMAGSDDDCRRKLGISGAAFGPMKQHGLKFEQAERYAERAGLLPYEVWPEMVDELIGSLERECAAEGCCERFIPSNPRRIYCSHICRDRKAKARWAQRRYQSDPEYAARRREASTARYRREREYILAQRRRRREVTA
jgi:hypothetical protein